MDTPVDKILVTLIEYVKANPKQYSHLSYADGLETALAVYNNAGYYDYNDISSWTEEELLEEALCWG